MRIPDRFLAILALAAFAMIGCDQVARYKSGDVIYPDFNGTFRGPIQSDLPTGQAIWGDSLEIKLTQVKVRVPLGQAKDSSPLIDGSGTSFGPGGAILKKFLIVGKVASSPPRTAALTITEFDTRKETTATATLGPAKDRIELSVDWPNGAKANGTLKKIQP